MGVLDRFEKGIERAVNGAFAKAFRSEVQPVEIASALRRECDEKASVVGRDRTIAPNAFVVELGRADHERLGEWETALGDELSAAVHEHARQQRYAFLGPVQVTFAEAEDLDTGVFRVRSQNARPDDLQQGQDRRYAPQQPYAGPQGQPQGQPQDQYPQQPQQPQYDQYGRPVADPYAAQQDPYAAQQDPYARPAEQQPYAAPGHGGLPAAPPFPGAPPAGYPVAPAPVPAGHQQPQPYQQPYQPPAAQQPQQPQPPYDQGGYAPSWTTPQTSLGTLDVDGRRQKIERAVTVIGRAMDVDVVLDDPGVSRRHAEVHVVDGKARVIDLGSTNGTFVDGERVHAGTLADGSTITVGRTRITYHSGQW